LADCDIIWRSFGMIPDVTVYPLADIHLGSEECDIAAFSELVNQIAGEERSYAVLAGDLIDNGVKSSVTNVYRQTMRPSEQKRQMAELLAPIRNKILCILPGNHERRSSKEDDDCPAYDIASKLDLEDVYRENAAFVRIGLGKRINNGKEYTYNLAVLHGTGGGMYAGSTVNKADNFLQAMDCVDILVTAHTHKPYALRGSKLVLDFSNHRVLQRPTLSICAGSWLNYCGYPMQKLLRPVAEPGANKLLLYGTRFRFEAVI
jgi:UDP-2,3-diacylglucosamine pyrophosphatase LpxH